MDPSRLGDAEHSSKDFAGTAKESFAKSGHSCFLRLQSDDSGQAITEYILLLSFVMAGVAAIMRALLPALNTVTMTIGGELEKDLKTGRAPLDVWKN